MESIMAKLSQAYQAEQHLEIQPTKHNLDIMQAVLSAISAAYEFIGSLQKPVTEPAGDADQSDEDSATRDEDMEG